MAFYTQDRSFAMVANKRCFAKSEALANISGFYIIASESLFQGP
jgi:hypothetical protein